MQTRIRQVATCRTFVVLFGFNLIFKSIICCQPISKDAVESCWYIFDRGPKTPSKGSPTSNPHMEQRLNFNYNKSITRCHTDCDDTYQTVPSEQLAASAGLGGMVLESAEAVSRQDAVALLSEGVVARGIPLRQLAGVTPRHQRVLQHGVPLFVPQQNLAPLLTRNLRGRTRR